MFSKEAKGLSEVIYSGTDVVDEYQTQLRSMDFEQFEHVEDAFQKEYAIKQYFEKISKLKPEVKLPYKQGKQKTQKIKMGQFRDHDFGDKDQAMIQKILIEKFQQLTGAECHKDKCQSTKNQECMRNLAFVIKFNKEEVHKLIFKSIIYDNELNKAYVNHD